MSTARARSIVLLGLIGLVVSMGIGNDGAAVVCLALILWVSWEWLRFCWALAYANPFFVDLSRNIRGVGKTTRIIAIEQTYEVECVVRPSEHLNGLRIILEDLVPAGCHLPSEPSWVVEDCDGSSIHWQYQLRPVVTGELRMLGFQARVCDRYGLFTRSFLVRHDRHLTVLPMVVRQSETVSVLKRDNVQILNGGHRYRRPGTGMELLGIRDYRHGDPPRNIAWKATARRGHLMTCEFESEVPVRSTIIADLSAGQYQGRPGPATADRTIAAIASIGRVLLADRDPVGCTLIADSHRTSIKHGHGERQLTRVFQTIFAHGRQHSAVSEFSVDDLVTAVWHAAQRRFPELFDVRLNKPRHSIFELGRRRRTLRGRRSQLAYLWTCLNGDPFAMVARLQHDDVAFRDAAARFVTEYSVNLRPPLRRFDVELDHALRKQAMKTLCQAVLEGVTRAKDNELFVLVGQLPVDDDDTECLVKTIRLARAKYHRTVFVETHSPETYMPQDPIASQMLRGMHQGIMGRRRNELHSNLVALGARMARVEDPRLMNVVLAELELLRHGRTGLVTQPN
ncbi:MAG: DUF58 domain-containing protein [Pirellulaceae bacterium]